MIKEIEKISRVTRSEVHNLLIEMTNEYIEYRNQIFDSSVIWSDGVPTVEDAEDRKYLEMMDTKIQKVLDFLE